MSAAGWSAIAAIFAAISSWMIFIVQRRNLLEQVRPELILTDWEREYIREEDDQREFLHFRMIRNVGRGPALHMNLNLEAIGNPPRAALGTIMQPIIPPADSVDVGGKITLWWQNVDPVKEGMPKHFMLQLKIFCWDSHGVRYETNYNMMVFEGSAMLGQSNVIADNVVLGNRTTSTRSGMRLKLDRRVKKIGWQLSDYVIGWRSTANAIWSSWRR